MRCLGVNRADFFFNQDYVVNLRLGTDGPVRACEIGIFSVYNSDTPSHITQISIPQDIFVSEEKNFFSELVPCYSITIVKYILE